MSKNEWKENARTARKRIDVEPNRRCKNCGEPLDFGDVRCPNCGADAHVKKVPYDDELKTSDIQARPRVHEGTGPQTADIDVGGNMLSKLDLFMPIFSLAAGVVAFFGVDADKPAIFKLCVGLLTAVGLWLFSTLLLIIAKNLATAAQNSEKEVGNSAFIIRAINEFLDKYDEGNYINDKNAEEFYRLTNRLIRVNEQQLGKRPKHRKNENAEAEEVIEETAVIEEAAEIEEAPVEAKEEPAEVKEEKPEEKEPEREPEKKPEAKKDEKKNGIKKKVMDIFEEDEPAEEKAEEPEEDGEEDDDIFDLKCPHCESIFKRTLSQLTSGTVACDVCGGMFKVELDEVEDDAEEEIGDEADGDADDDFGDDWEEPGNYNDDGFFDGKGDILDK